MTLSKYLQFKIKNIINPPSIANNGEFVPTVELVFINVENKFPFSAEKYNSTKNCNFVKNKSKIVPKITYPNELIIQCDKLKCNNIFIIHRYDCKNTFPLFITSMSKHPKLPEITSLGGKKFIVSPFSIPKHNVMMYIINVRITIMNEGLFKVAFGHMKFGRNDVKKLSFKGSVMNVPSFVLKSMRKE